MILEGTVEQGKHLGRELGYPTANISLKPGTVCTARNGVYAAALWIGRDERAWPGMLNQGVHPTAPEGKPTVEVHLPGYAGDIYGVPVRVEYLRFLRPEQRFENLEALTAQLSRDREELLGWIREALAEETPDALDSEQRRAREILWHEEAPIRTDI